MITCIATGPTHPNSYMKIEELLLLFLVHACTGPRNSSEDKYINFYACSGPNRCEFSITLDAGGARSQ